MSRRKAEMVLELVDRASRPARRFIALQKRMGRAVERTNRTSAKTSRAAQRATDLYTRAVRGLDRAQDALRAGLRRTNEAVARNAARLRTSAAMMRGGVMGMGRAALLAGGIMTAYSGTVSAAGMAMLGPARQFEKFETVLTTTEGSALAAKKAMGWVENFAVRTPYELDQVMESFVQLRAYGLDPTNGMLKTLGNASAAMNKPLMQSVEAMADAVTGENERLKELGIKAAKVGKYFEYSYTGKDGSAKVVRALASDRKAIQAAILGVFSEKYDGAMDRLALTFDGMLSNILDQWTKFQRMIMGAGVFDWMKSKLKLVLDELNRLEQSGQLEIWASRIANHILIGLEAIWNFGAAAVRFWRSFYPWLQSAADALGGWRNLALAVIAIPFRGFIFGAAAGLLQFAGGALLAGRALAGIGLASAGGGALRLGSAMLAMLNPLNLVRAAFVAIRVAIISTGIGALVVGLAMAGTWIYNNWSGLVAFFQSFGAAFMNALGPARPVVDGVVEAGRRVWDWITSLVGPLNASAETWRSWGAAAGAAVGNAAKFVGELPGKLVESMSSAWAGVRNWMAEMWFGLSSHAQTAWEGLQYLLLNYTPQGLIYSHWGGITDFFRGLWDEVTAIFTSAWALIQSTVIAPLTNAVSFMTDNKLTRGVAAAKAGVANWLNGGDVQEKASGGFYRAGPVLVGERGPELRYASRGGYIAHNRSLRNMVAMSKVARSAATAGALVAGGAAFSGGAAADGERYLTARSGGSVSISAPMTLRIDGNVDAGVMPGIEAALQRFKDELAEEVRDAKRRSHD